MADKRQVKAVKDRLMEYRDREREIAIQLGRIEALDEEMQSLKSPELTGMPKGGSVADDRLVRKLARKDELKHRVKELTAIQVREEDWIRSVLSHVKGADARACILIRYVDMGSWDRTSYCLFGSYEDYEDRKESYMKRTMRAHGRALQQMGNYLAERGLLGGECNEKKDGDGTG